MRVDVYGVHVFTLRQVVKPEVVTVALRASACKKTSARGSSLAIYFFYSTAKARALNNSIPYVF